MHRDVDDATGLTLDFLLAGTGASLGSALAAMLAARAEGEGALQPLNATSHWLHGPEAGDVEEFDAAHSGVGIGTHHLSAMFWAAPYALWLASEPERSTGEIVGGAIATAAVAATVDYGLMPRRLSPGWELALRPRGMVAAFAGLAAGLAGGALLARALRRA
jgi:hypothetical protein